MLRRVAVVGLGNPGPKYRGTRHNIGFEVLEHFAGEVGATLGYRQHSLLAQTQVDGVQVLVLLPQTYMNESGAAVREALRYFRVADPADLIVVHDEIDLAVGRVQIKQGGGLAGHNGLKSIAHHLGSKEFSRIRIGVGRPQSKEDVVGYVLHCPSAEERELLDVAVVEATASIFDLIRHGPNRAMSLHNHRSLPEVG